jgi:hypothetical protein
MGRFMVVYSGSLRCQPPKDYYLVSDVIIEDGKQKLFLHNIKAALTGPLCEEYWCKDCKLPVNRDHKHWQSCIPIKEAREADAYVNLFGRIQQAIQVYEGE